MKSILYILSFLPLFCFGQTANLPQPTGIKNTVATNLGGQRVNQYLRIPQTFTTFTNINNGGILWFDSVNTRHFYGWNGVANVQLDGGGSGGTPDTPLISAIATDTTTAHITDDTTINDSYHAGSTSWTKSLLRNFMLLRDFGDSVSNYIIQEDNIGLSSKTSYSSLAMSNILLNFPRMFDAPAVGDMLVYGMGGFWAHMPPSDIPYIAGKFSSSGGDITGDVHLVSAGINVDNDVNVSGAIKVGGPSNQQFIRNYDTDNGTYMDYGVGGGIIGFSEGATNGISLDLNGGNRSIVVRPINGTMALLSDITGTYVTSVGVSAAHGVSATNIGTATDPVFSFTLGAITPSSIVATGTVAGSNLSGTNTGDQTNITGNAGTATALQTARNINGTSFNGTANITIAAAAGTITGGTLASGVTASSLTSVGTLSAGTWQASIIGVQYGGTGSNMLVTSGFVRQSTSGANFTAAAISASDLPNSGVAAATYGSATATGVYTVDATGRITNAANTTITPAVGSITGLATGISTFLGSPSSANFLAAVTDETGSGAVVGATSPTLVTPSLGVATATSINKLAIPAPATSATLTPTDGKNFTYSNTMALAGTDGNTYTFPASTATIPGNNISNSWSGTQTFTSATSITLASAANMTMSATSVIGSGTGNITSNYSTGATTSGNTKSVNIGTAGISGSTTNVNIGSSVSGATSNTTMNGITSINQIARLYLSTGNNTGMLTATLSSGAVTVSNTSVTANSKFNIDYNPGGQSIGIGNVSTRFYVSTITAGTSFVVVAETLAGVANTTDNSTLTILIAN